jgi:hypothetical protein
MCPRPIEVERWFSLAMYGGAPLHTFPARKEGASKII